ncbi:hypothetical protein [Nocardioides campestrisoli]|uniref:hypothetical protein n=1 Tax=Nocardioides campestrisoli TaxID=2736757 RepID=UPI00163DD491|nr:hypothetical protein [Nocardioides campestrisoli]
MSSQPAVPTSFVQTLRVLTTALVGAPVIIGVVLAFAGGTDESDEWLTAAPDPIFAGVLLVAGVALFALIPARGYKMPPLSPGTDADAARAQAKGRFQSATFLRFALAEAPVLIGIALAFVDSSYLLYLIGAVIGLALMFLHVVPNRRVVERSAEVLEAQGVDSGLRQEFGYDHRL